MPEDAQDFDTVRVRELVSEGLGVPESVAEDDRVPEFKPLPLSEAVPVWVAVLDRDDSGDSDAVAVTLPDTLRVPVAVCHAVTVGLTDKDGLAEKLPVSELVPLAVRSTLTVAVPLTLLDRLIDLTRLIDSLLVALPLLVAVLDGLSELVAVTCSEQVVDMEKENVDDRLP